MVMALGPGNRGTSTDTAVPYRQMDSDKRGVAVCIAVITIILVSVIAGFASTTHFYDHSDSPSSDGSPAVATPAKTPYPGSFRPPLLHRPQGIPDYVWNMAKMMSDSHPCDDFYRYSCGQWMEENPASDFQHHSPFQNMRDDVHSILSRLLDRPSSSQEPKAVQKAKRLYKSCMDMNTINQQASGPLMDILGEVNAHDNVVDMLVAMAKFNSYPMGIVTVTKDAKNTTRNVILLDQPYLPLTQLTQEHKEYTGYKNFINEVVYQLNIDKRGRGSRLIRDVYSLIRFQHGLTALTTKKEDRPKIDGLYHMYTLGALNHDFPQFDWNRYIRGMFSQPEMNITLADDQPVLVYAPNYFRRVGEYVSNFDKNTVKDYMRWKFIEGYLPYMAERFRTARRKLLKAGGFILKSIERWKICTPEIDAFLFNITGRMFVEQELDSDSVTVTKEMVQDIRKVFKERMQADSWMDSKTKQTAIEKLDAIRELIGYPPDIMNDTLLDQQFEDLIITDHFFDNIVAAVKRRHWSILQSLRQPAVRDRWDHGATTVNAFYKSENNIIVIPAGILRKPIFSLEYPKSVIYSSLGFIVAHEMTHGFDNTGRKFDKEGNLVDWWSETAEASYRQKDRCYVNQYSSYTIKDYTKVNGTKTLGENIADNGGIRDAFMAYTEWVNRQAKVSTVPFLGLTNNQVFYLAFAQRWCETRGSKFASYDAKKNLHSPGEFRVKGTLQNSNHFAQTFSCASGTLMNFRSKKCRIW
ncbi:neprilysin-like [Liolophura sinensis]|uniref:neprilysin-like n=1 Tax=Liolophura sinensis TaxID=3198878 RepID=UPI0031582567